MTSPVLPWAIIAKCQANSLSGLVQIYEPYNDHVALRSQPASLTFLGWDQLETFGPGLYTSLQNIQGETVICNFLELTPAPSQPLSPSLYAKRSVAISPGLIGRLFKHLCLEFTDIVIVRAKSVEEAVGAILSFRDCIRSNMDYTTVQFHILFETSSSQLETSKMRIKSLLQTALATDVNLLQWASRIMQHLTVQSFEPQTTLLSDLLTVLKPFSITMKKQRAKKGHLWTLAQLMYLFEQYIAGTVPFTTCRRALPHLASSWPGATWYPMAFRKQFWPGRDLQKNNGLSKWFRAANKDVDLNIFLAPIFARMFREDANILPQSFPSPELFASIYEPLCVDAWYQVAQECDWIRRRDHITFLHAVASKMGISRSVLYHEAQEGLRRIGDNSLCCMCPWDRQPLILFPCGHGICERDAWRYSGIQPDDIEYPTLAHFTACPACRTSMDIKVRLRPLQAGYRVAALDGGGVFGMALLIMLRDTGEGLPSDMPMYLFFDVVACTSTGSLVGCAVFEKQLSLADCIKMFHSTAKDVFYKRVGLRARVKRYLCLWKNGAQYDIAVFCNILKDQFGVALMRGGIAERKQEIVRMAITSTTFASKLCLYRSYGDALREEEHGDYVSQKVTDLPLWQAVATSCAAPLMFEPPDQGEGFDGLFAANCPAWVAMMEINELSMLENRQLDFLVSFGTGQFLHSGEKRSRQWFTCLVPEWVRRLGCCLRRAVDADAMYGKFLNTLDRAERNHKHHRLEPLFTKSPTAPDDPSKLQEIESETDSYMRRPDVIQRTSRLQLAMLASCFYGALLSPPKFDSNIGQYRARLAILSRWPENNGIVKSLSNKLRTASFLVNAVRHDYQTPLYCTVYLGSVDVPIEISLKLDGEKSHPISGFPLSITQMIYLQPPPYASPRIARKRGESFPTDYRTKRRRLGEVASR